MLKKRKESLTGKYYLVSFFFRHFEIRPRKLTFKSNPNDKKKTSIQTKFDVFIFFYYYFDIVFVKHNKNF